jgi:serine/threonine protein kinase
VIKINRKLVKYPFRLSLFIPFVIYAPFWLFQIRNEKARRYLSCMRKKHPIPFSQKFRNADPLALPLLERLLAFDPKDRPTAEEVIFFLKKHSFLSFIEPVYKCIKRRTCNDISFAFP